MIVGVAGHVDHGKTALVRALTGVETDRLPQEQARGMTIDLGFAYLPAPTGGVIGFVDMPGHERFMRNMLAGASGIDLLLLVVAADDGVMPQTREHLAVAQLLGLARAVVVVSKVDAVPPQRVAEVVGAAGQLLAGTPFAHSPVLPVSAQSGAGLAALRDLLFAAAQQPVARQSGPMRFAVDRSFSLAGQGTVATGVVVQGRVAVGDVLLVSPAGHQARVRSLHVQGRAAQVGHTGQRCGISLGGRISTDQVARGDWLVDPTLHQPVARFDALLRLLPDEPRPLRHWTPVRLHHGAAELAAQVAVLQHGPLEPGAECFVQLVCERPLVPVVGDRFVLRAANGSRTLGGGRVVDLHPPARRRKQPQRLAQLAALAVPDPAAALAAQLACWPEYVDAPAFARDRALDDGALAPVLAAVPHAALGNWLLAPAGWQQMAANALAEVRQFHQRFPRLLGPNLGRLHQALGPRLPQGLAAAVLDRLLGEGQLVRESGVYRLPDHRLGLDRGDADLWRRIAPLLEGEARFRPPLVPEVARALALREFDCRRVLKVKLREGAVAEVAPDRFLTRAALAEVGTIIGQLAAAAPDGLFGAADLRNRLDNGRKVAIALLDHFDRLRITSRRGDLRLVDLDRLARFRAGQGD